MANLTVPINRAAFKNCYTNVSESTTKNFVRACKRYHIKIMGFEYFPDQLPIVILVSWINTGRNSSTRLFTPLHAPCVFIPLQAPPLHSPAGITTWLPCRRHLFTLLQASLLHSPAGATSSLLCRRHLFTLLQAWPLYTLQASPLHSLAGATSSLSCRR